MNDTGRDDVAALLSPVDAGTLSRLHRRLEREAEQADLVDVAYTIVDSPVGRILLTGAMVVLPVWLVLRLLDSSRR